MPYSAWGAELSRSYEGRSRVTLVREGFTFVGTLAALLLQYAYSGGETGGTDQALSAFAMVMAVALRWPPWRRWRWRRSRMIARASGCRFAMGSGR